MPADLPVQQPCVHCGDCTRACPEGLDPEALFFALATDAWPAACAGRLDACNECNRCVEVCPSHIPLLDWFRWGKPELVARARASAARARFLAREARLARAREARNGRPRDGSPSAAASPVRTISRDEVLAAIARGHARKTRAKSIRTVQFEAAVVSSQAKDGRSDTPTDGAAPLAELPDRAAIGDDRTR